MNSIIHSIRFPFSLDHGVGTLSEETRYAEHVEQLIRQVLLTSPGERVNRPDFGCGLREMVFASNSDVTASLAQIAIYQALEKWLGDLIRVNKIEVLFMEERMDVKIAYSLKTQQENRYLNLEVNL